MNNSKPIEQAEPEMLLTVGLEELLERLEKIDSDPIGAGLARNWHRNPDGPEAAARIRELEAEANDHAERASHWRKTAGEYQARIEGLEATLGRIRWAIGLVPERGRIELDRAIAEDLRAGLSLRKCAAKHGVNVGTVRGARARALLGERGE